jgi:hypothetical protein
MLRTSAVGSLLFAFCITLKGASAWATLDAKAIGDAAGVSATTTPDGVVRLAYPRKEIEVKVDGVAMRPFAGLTTWAAFTETKGGAMVMGDTVVFEDEVTPALDAAFSAGLEVTALHNHFLYDDPKVFFMHVGGVGQPVELAKGIRMVWDAVKAVRASAPTVASSFGGPVPTQGAIDAAALESALGQKSTSDSGMVKFTIGREAEMDGIKVGSSMGLTTWAAFSGSNELAAIDGDVIMTAPEVQTVLHALRKSGLYVVALHNHMIGETPALYFVHYWGKGPAVELADGLRYVLDAQKLAETKSGAGHGAK